jgi:hypothetical protein
MYYSEEITPVELRRLLYDLRDKRPDIGLRFRLTGQLWATNFARIESISEMEVVVLDEKDRTFTNRFQDIMQFEIDSPFQNYRPFYHYKIATLKESKLA